MRIHYEEGLLHMEREGYTDTCQLCGLVMSMSASLGHLRDVHDLVLDRSNKDFGEWVWVQKQRVLR